VQTPDSGRTPPAARLPRSRLTRTRRERGLARAALLLTVYAASVGGCAPTGVVGTYLDAGGRCDPLTPTCPAGTACTLREDPALDACRPTGALEIGAACETLDACGAGAVCAVVDERRMRIDVEAIAAGGTCARVCGREAPVCPSPQQCHDLGRGSTLRVDFGACAP
jgi:hypothetical protein